MAIQSLDEEIECSADLLRQRADHESRSTRPRPNAEHGVAIAAAAQPRALLDRQTVGSRLGSIASTVAYAPDAVRRLVALASDLLREEPTHQSPGSSIEVSRLQRVARLRDELHVTANRVARFGDDEHPVLDSVRITAPTASSAVLAPAQLLFQLDLTADRLVAHLDALSRDDWVRTGQMGDRLVTLGEVVERVLHTATNDVLELLRAAPVSEGDGIAAVRRRAERP